MKEVKNIKYLILDVEWYQPSNTFELDTSKITQLSAIAVDNNFKKIDEFFEIIKPEKDTSIDFNSCAFTGIKENDLATAYSKNQCFEMFFNKFSKFDNIVI